MINMITQDTYEQEVMKAEGTVLVDFYADWCGPCKMMGPVVEELAGEFEGKFKVGKVNVDQQPELAQRYGVMSIPFFAFIKNGNVYDSEMGAVPKERLVRKMEAMV